MITLIRPTPKQVEAFIHSQSQLPYTYEGLGMSRNAAAPEGYRVLHHRIELGKGLPVFYRAKEALNSWVMFELGWVELKFLEPGINPRQTVCVLVKQFGLWMLNASQIVYIFDEELNGKSAYGFAYGTLQDHAEKGEERFSVEILSDESVWYDLYSFSLPNWKIAQLGNPYVRMLQKRFARESMQAMKRYVLLNTDPTSYAEEVMA